MAGVGYIRREIGAGDVKFIVADIPWGTVAIPAGAAALFIYAASKVFPSLPAVIAVGVGGFLFYWLRIRLKQRALNSGDVYIVSPTGLIAGDRTILRAHIQKVSWIDSSPDSPFPDSGTRHWNTTVRVETVSGPWINVAMQMEAGQPSNWPASSGRRSAMSPCPAAASARPPARCKPVLWIG